MYLAAEVFGFLIEKSTEVHTKSTARIDLSNNIKCIFKRSNELTLLNHSQRRGGGASALQTECETYNLHKYARAEVRTRFFAKDMFL